MAFHKTKLSYTPGAEINPDYKSVASTTDIEISERANRAPMTEQEASKEMSQLAGELTVKAKYKIEVTYMSARQANKPSVCGVSVWESGKRFHGGGDQSMFWCTNVNNPEEGCGGLIPDDHVRGGVALCPHCKKMVNQKLMPVERVGVFTAPNLAKEITKIFRHLGGNADIYLKFHKTDAKAITALRANGQNYREAAIYTLDRITRDTMGGADVTSRFEAFLTA